MKRKKEKNRFYALKICLAMIVVFFIQIFFKNFTNIFILNKNSWNEIWRFAGSIFLHANLGHLFYNLFALFLFGLILENYIGSKRFLIVFFTSGIIANLIAVNFYDSSLGASGAIFGIIGTLIVLRPLLVIWAFGMPMPILIAGFLWMGGDLLGAYASLIGKPINNTGNIAHLAGIFFGFIIGLIFKPPFQKKL